MEWIKHLSDIGIGIVLPLLIIGSGFYFTKFLGGFYLLRPARTLRLALSKEGTNGVSPLRALSVSLAGTLGVGNITGVAVAIMLGGAGSLFWMWISAFFSMILKYAEIVLGMRYRIYENGKFLGGPMYYMEKGIGGILGKTLACIFALFGVISAFSMGSPVQMKAASDAIYQTFSFPPLLFGFLSAVFCAFLLFGGYEKISRATAILIPMLSAVYLFMAIRIVWLESDRIYPLCREIFKQAFSFSSASGGIFGFFTCQALRHGIAKGSFSHEAGCGTAPLAHTGAETKIPAKQGILGIFEVFFDTVVLCSLTGFVILLSGESLSAENGMALVMHAFAKYYGSVANYLIAVSVMLFALAAVVCWGYYGKAMLSYLTKSETVSVIYILLFCIVSAFGTVMTEGMAWQLSDLTVALMTLINLFAVFILRREIREETEAAGLCPPKNKHKWDT
ncbi:MAG: sodium:alanine symporter family protein [Clostridia bacterium]|nr:sodium:alanine symporter family protein [Clostridia bacterium]